MFLPAGVTIPEFYTARDADPQKVSDALRVGATAVQSSVTEMASVACARLLASERDKVAAAHEAALRRAVAEVEASAMQRGLQLELELERARMQRDEFQARARAKEEDAERGRESERAFFQTQLAAVQAALSNVQQEREYAREQVAEARRGADKSAQNSSVKGAEGEADVERVIVQAFSMCPGFSMVNESKMAGRGDRLTCIMGLRVMWEVKAHAALRGGAGAGAATKRKVERKDVAKLQENAATAHDFDVCVMVALHANITGHDKHPVEAEYAGRVLLIYVNQLFGGGAPPIDVLQWHVGSLLTAHAKLKQMTEIGGGGGVGAASGGEAAAIIGEEAAAAAVGRADVEKLTAQIAVYVADAAKLHAERKRMLGKHQKLMHASFQEMLEEQHKAEMGTQEGLTRLMQQAQALCA